MRTIKLSVKLTLIVVVLSVLIVSAAAVAIGAIVFIQTENRVRSQLAEKSAVIVTEYLSVSDSIVQPKDQGDGSGLAAALRNFDLSLFIAGRDGQSLARYGIFRNLDDAAIGKFVPPELLDRAGSERRGIYRDIDYMTNLYDTYTLPLLFESELVGFLQVAQLNFFLPILTDSLLLAAMILLPLIWLVSLAAAGWSTRLALNPLKRLVNYVERVDLGSRTRPIQIPRFLDHEVAVLSAAFNQMISRAHSTLTRQRQIAENISHEFKSPLTRISTGLQVAALDAPGKLRGELKKLETEAVVLGKNVDTLLDLAVNEKQNSAPARPLLVLPLVKELIRSVPAGIKVTVAIPKTLLIHLPFGHGLILFKNLITNAAKHNFPGGYIRLAASGGVNGWQAEIVNSTGNRIKNIHKLVERHYAEPRHFSAAGFGVGLAIVAEICRQQNLQLDISQPAPDAVRVMING